MFFQCVSNFMQPNTLQSLIIIRMVNYVYRQISLIWTPNNRNSRYPTQNCRELISSHAFYPFNLEIPLSDTEVSKQMC